MRDFTRKLLMVAAGVLVLGAANLGILRREQLLQDGRVVFLELAPVDPRSLLQGDYMALNYRIANAAFAGRAARQRPDGFIVASLDARGVASFVRFADERPPMPGEVLLRYRIRGEQPKFATNAFFFQEGTGKRYERASYGEFRVAPNGDMILTGLRGKDLEGL